MEKRVVFLTLCALTIIVTANPHRSKRAVQKPMSQGEVQYFLSELSELQDKLTGGGGGGSRDRSKKRKGRHEESWRAGTSWWEKKTGKKSGSSWSSMSSYRCGQSISYGNTECTETSVRFYYERESKMCRRFHYTGCGGNKNNFRSKHECLKTCKH